MASVGIKKVGKRFGAVEVLRDINIEIDDGEFVVLVGPSGCGKSTLLRMIAGLEDISDGEITIDNVVVNDVSPKKRNIAMVFQSYALYPHMNVFDNIALSLRLSNIDAERVDGKVQWAAKLLDLQDLLDRRPSQLSGGQRQRVAMGRAIVRDPSVFLFDEPLSNLDAKLRVQMRTEIRALHQDLNATTIYVTHDQIEAMTMADRIIIMDKGRILQTGTPLEVYDRPSNLQVAEFIGSPAMNRLGTGSIVDGRFLLARQGSGGGTVQVPDSMLSNLEGAVSGQQYVLGVRPEDVIVSADADGLMPGEVRVVEPTGADTIISIMMDGEEITALARDRIQMRPADRVSISIRDHKASLFDEKSGERA